MQFEKNPGLLHPEVVHSGTFSQKTGLKWHNHDTMWKLLCSFFEEKFTQFMSVENYWDVSGRQLRKTVFQITLTDFVDKGEVYEDSISCIHFFKDCSADYRSRESTASVSWMDANFWKKEMLSPRYSILYHFDLLWIEIDAFSYAYLRWDSYSYTWRYRIHKEILTTIWFTLLALLESRGPCKKYVTLKIGIFDPPSPPCHTLSSFGSTPLPPCHSPKSDNLWRWKVTW